MIRPIEDPNQDPDLLTPGEANMAAQPRLQTTEAAPEPAESPSILLDTLAAPFRGVEGAVQSIYQLADFITADSLPDYDQRFLGRSKTTPGSIVENVAQFLTGFIPIAGQVSKLGQAIGITSKIATAAAAGAATDFLAFDGHEERLSNLLRKELGLKDAVTGYLAADPNDGELEGRFKNSLEGLGLGVAADTFMASMRGLKSIRQLRAGVKAGEEAKAARIAAEEAEKLRVAAEDGLTKIKSEKPVIDTEVVPEEAPLLPPTEQIAAGAKALDEWKTVLANFDPSEMEGGKLFQSPEKFIGRYLDTDADTVNFLEGLAKKIEEVAPSKVETQAVTEQRVAQQLSDLQGIHPDAALRWLRQGEAMGQAAQYRGLAAVKLTVALAEEAKVYSKAATQGLILAGDQSADQTILRAIKAQQRLAQLVAISKGYGTIAARSLRQRRFIQSASIEAREVAREMLDNLGGESFAKAELQKVVLAYEQNGGGLNSAAAVTKLSAGTLSVGDKILRAHNEYWLNAILSGTKTSVVNTLGNSFTTLWQPLEQAIGSAFLGDTKAVRASLKNYYYLAESVREAGQFALRAFKENDNILVQGRGVSENLSGPWINAGKFGGPETKGFAAEARAVAGQNREGTLLQHFINFAGENIRMPQRFLLSADEFFKQLNYRAAAKTELFYRGLDRGLADDALHGFVADNFDRVVTEGGQRYTEGAVYREAISQADTKGLTGRAKNDFIQDFVKTNWNPNNSALAEAFDVGALANGVAEEATFTAPLGKLGKGVQQFAQSHPLFQLFLPFVRTPTNIVKYFGQRGLNAALLMPGIENIQARNLADLGSKDALVRSRAVGRIAGGQMLVTMAGLAALEGKITGRGPRDENEKRLLMETGWQPYSIKFETAEGPLYVSYQRLDPFATFLGLMADWGDTAKRMDPIHSDDTEKLVTVLGTAVSNNITNKTYLASLAQVIDAVNQPERKFATWARARVASYVPSLFAQFRDVTDDGQTMREIRSFWDATTNRIPGMSGSLEPKRNVLGEPIESPLAQTPLSVVNPLTVSKDAKDPVFQELAKFRHGLQPPSPALYGAIDLLGDRHRTPEGRSAYDRWQELTGEVKIGGKTLREKLAQTFKSRDYQRLSDAESANGLDTPRLFATRRIIGAYRDVAMAQLQREIPSIREDIRAYHNDQLGLRRGKRAEQLAALIQQ